MQVGLEEAATIIAMIAAAAGMSFTVRAAYLKSLQDRIDSAIIRNEISRIRSEVDRLEELVDDLERERDTWKIRAIKLGWKEDK